ncbi:MAG TPA: MXAN_5187 C-terminal domain-containing protein, partial [Myxococcota bacterium]|nr:MXAN_5187 C-terminal domain-containing protein [Myxococcota bacterium]
RLRSLPKPTGVDPVLSLDGQVRMGRPPDGASIDSNASEAFLLAPRDVRSAVPGLGSVGVAPLFVAPGSVGVWARRFEVPRVPSAVGYVYTDVTPAFAELGGLQLMTLLLAAVAFAIHALLIVTSGLGMTRGIAAMSDFLGKQQQGLGDGSRLSERNLPSGLHRLARLVNKSLERGSGNTPSIVSARHASLDDVIAHHEPATPDVSELDFGSFAAPKAEASQFKAPTMEMKRPPVPSTTAPKAETAAAPADPAPAAALSDPGSAALLASLEELSESLAGDEGPSFAAEPSLPAPKVNGATGKAIPAPAPVTAKADSAGPAPAVTANETPRDTHYREVYQRFVEVRLECGEPTDDLTYDKFTAKLGQSRDAVMSKHACTDVRFQVYVKNGKAALKATPVK